MNDLLNKLNKKKLDLEKDLENQKMKEEDATKAQEVAEKALNDFLKEREAHYEQEKMKINAKIELIDELLND